jgi:hypothetical protein
MTHHFPRLTNVSEDCAVRETPPRARVFGERFELPFQFGLRRGRNIALARANALLMASGQVDSSVPASLGQGRTIRTRATQVERGKKQ